MVFESWALGKPVIFPRWCIDVRTLMERNPLSAEAFIYRNRIGLHPESPKEMHKMLRAINKKRIQDPSCDTRGDGVSEFIDHYIDVKNRGFDAQRTADELVSILSEIS
jgi:CDP-glycerol glycerophosphotransferase